MRDYWFENPRFVKDSEWPFKISDDELDAVNEVLPEGYEYTRRVGDDQTGYYLLKFETGEERSGDTDTVDKAEVIADVLTTIWGSNPQITATEVDAEHVLDKVGNKFDSETIENARQEAGWD